MAALSVEGTSTGKGKEEEEDDESDEEEEDEDEAALAAGLPGGAPPIVRAPAYSWRQRTLAQAMSLGWAPAGVPGGLLAEKTGCLFAFRSAIARGLVLGSAWAVETAVARLLNSHRDLLAEDALDPHALLPGLRAAWSEGLAALVALGSQRVELVLTCALAGARAAEASAAAHFAGGRWEAAAAEWRLAVALCSYPVLGPGSLAGGAEGKMGSLTTAVPGSQDPSGLVGFALADVGSEPVPLMEPSGGSGGDPGNSKGQSPLSSLGTALLCARSRSQKDLAQAALFGAGAGASEPA